MPNKYMHTLTPFLKPRVVIQESEGLPSATIENQDENLKANAYYFGQTEWIRESLEVVHSYPELRVTVACSFRQVGRQGGGGHRLWPWEPL